MEDSIFSLSNQLCSKMSEVHAKEKTSFDDFVQSVERDKERRKLLRRNKETLFSILLKKRVIKVPKVYEMSINDRIASHAYEMADRNELENSRLLLEEYEKLEVTPEVEQILKLLLELKDTAPPKVKSNLINIGDGIAEYNNVKNQETFPYGIKSSLKPFTVYKDYPRNVFEIDQDSLGDGKLKLYSQTSFMLNDDFKSLELFSLEPKLGLDTDIASIYSDINEEVKSEVSEQDEGYISPVPQEDPTEIWDKIWEVEVPRRRTWEKLGSKLVDKELPYLSEVGPDAVHHAWNIGKKFIYVLPILNC